jgi:hypothetical protein
MLYPGRSTSVHDPVHGAAERRVLAAINRAA